jgi:hypothetical protein
VERIMVRRLPVLQNKDADVDPNRPKWHWFVIGAGFVVTLFLPLSMLALWIGARMGPPASLEHPPSTLLIVARALPVAFSFMFACGAAGFLVGRFGKLDKSREAALAGVLGAFASFGLSLLGRSSISVGSALISLAVLSVLAAFSGWFGGWLGMRRQS